MGLFVRFKKDVKSLNDRGNKFISKGEYEKALESFDKSIELDSKRFESWYNMGIYLNNLERYEEALDSYNNSLELNP